MTLFSLGSNGRGQLGIGHDEDVSCPTPITTTAILESHISCIRAGGNHTLLLTQSGQVYATGDNSDGRCAVLTSTSTAFTRTLLSNIKFYAATWDASIFVRDGGQAVAVCGTGLKGELGLGSPITSATCPTTLPNFPPANTHVVDLAACMGHIVAVLNNGDVWGWGNGQQGQLGEPAEVVWQPRKINGVTFPATRAACGKDFTVIFGRPQEGTCAVVGLKKRDRFGIKASCPQSVKGWTDVQATWGSIFVLYKDGTLFGWGRNDHGQLPPEGLPAIRSFAAGSEHVVALTTSGTAMAWGWGEHGNCGEPVDHRKDVKDRWNELIADKAIGVAAGCATTWIITDESPS